MLIIEVQDCKCSFFFSVGIKPADNQSEGMLLYVAGMENGVSISKLEDSDIKEVNYSEPNSYVTGLYITIVCFYLFVQKLAKS